MELRVDFEQFELGVQLNPSKLINKSFALCSVHCVIESCMSILAHAAVLWILFGTLVHHFFVFGDRNCDLILIEL